VIFNPDKDGNPPVTVEDVQGLVGAALQEISSKEVKVELIANKEAGKKLAGGPSGDGVIGSGAPLPVNGCEKERVLGVIELCVDSKQRFFNIIIFAIVLSGLLAGATVLTSLRAMRYRKDLTRLTAQVAQLRK
jgi:hypothetical protein